MFNFLHGICIVSLVTSQYGAYINRSALTMEQTYEPTFNIPEPPTY